MTGTSKGHLSLSLPPEETLAHRVPGIHMPLLSVGQACNSGHIIIFDKEKLQIFYPRNVTLTHSARPVIEGRCLGNKLWGIPLPTAAPPTLAYSAYHQFKLPDLATFLHAAAGYLTIPTFCKAIDAGFFATWPSLTSNLIHKHLPKSIPTVMGKIKRARQGARSTQRETLLSLHDATFSPPRDHRNRHHEVGANAFA